MKKLFASVLLILTVFGAISASCGTIPYPNSGTPNPNSYSFTATSTGDIIAYFVSKGGASYNNELGLLINGVSTGIIGLDNQTTSFGQMLDLGHANAGDSLIFVLQNNTLQKDAYSDPSLNVPYDNSGVTNHNHIYSTDYSGGSGVPAGTYVGFEDLPFPNSDYNYNDESFVFVNVTGTIVGAPESCSTLALFSIGMTALAFGVSIHRRDWKKRIVVLSINSRG